MLQYVKRFKNLLQNVKNGIFYDFKKQSIIKY